MPYVYAGSGPPPPEFAAMVREQENIDARTQRIRDGLVRLSAIETQARSNAGLRGPDPWTQPQRVAVLDAIADVAQAVRWLAQQQVAPGDDL